MTAENMLTLSAVELAAKLRAGEITAVDLTQATLDRIHAENERLNAFLFIDDAGALAVAKQVDADRAAGKELPPFAGVPIALKDNICEHGTPVTCGSKMLDGWIAPYDATVVKNIKAARLPIVGHTNMDEFAMGSSTETSAFGPSVNPWGDGLTPGGSGGGSAAAVAGYLVPWALGSDTGGSIRQPGSFTGTVGAKPTYGNVSRYGVVAMASSLDQVGPVARTVADAAALQEIISSHDPLDSTSLPEPATGLLEAADDGAKAKDLAGLRLGVVKELAGEGFEPGVSAVFEATVASLKERGAKIVEISLPSFEYAIAAYYLIMPAEVSSNMARFDGVRYGNRVEPETGPVTAETMMKETRGKMFGPEVKRRIILGTYALSSGHYDQFYGSALRVRTLVQRDLAEAFAQVDAVITPTAPTTAFKFGSKSDDLMAMYMNDMTTTPANLAGIPAMSVPAGLSDGLPVGVQVFAPAHEDARMYKVAAMIEAGTDTSARECPITVGEEA
ncbi:Asp-tRNA(Asn)/Glu-tRNA(Gln) amidotransferase subunit GatA [Trueperella bialowiezensis]|uniref:Glutamyl-tRNA(Gln) amidotransferase subunit A n=1 Tax=Trueperella bialowiezensis TaxID=312285 RepID=A0A3S4X6R9_9ACTO|nr:Asp-tRNA(Asn)/Glu-tRNA(Gln) amidotransferase subunit GatA [Trueperella bialowiezensis]VEI13892.1 Glutamyl-tRNA(Gln) amidotransferase subunit A [Trueperella bialowiezensis]